MTVVKGGRLHVADSVFIGRGVVISVHSLVEIGKNTLIAEYVCIHDNDHVMDGAPGARPRFRTSPVSIGEDCWLGAHAVVLKGAGMARGSVLGAGAVLTTRLDENTVAAGVPARPLKAGSNADAR
jgi:acetyltransferase-like isoleucine patch superfamily enzyme